MAHRKLNRHHRNNRRQHQPPSDRRSQLPNRQKIDTRASGVSPIFECQITSYDRPPSGEGFENLSLRSVQIRVIVSLP